MKFVKQCIVTILILAMVFSSLPDVIFAKEVLEEEIPQEEVRGKFNSVLIPENGERKDEFSSNNFYQYYQINLSKKGKLNVKFSSSKFKNKVKLWIYYDELCSDGQSKVLSYDKKKKVTKGTLTSKYIMNPGTYYIMVQPIEPNFLVGKKPIKYSLVTKVEEIKFDDIEPNTIESDAQAMSVKEINKKQKIYNMYLCQNENFKDTSDMLYFTLKSKKAVNLKVTTASKAKLHIILKRIEPSGLTSVVNTKKQYLESKGKKVTYSYDSKKLLTKGKYLVSVVLESAKSSDIVYSVSASTYTPIEKISVSNTVLKMTPGVNKNIKYKLNQGATELVEFQSENPLVATVDSKGKVKAKKIGTTKINIVSKNTNKKVRITIKVIPIKVKTVKLNKTKLVFNKGNKDSLQVAVVPRTATNKKVQWSSSNKKVATVNQEGKVKAVGIGTAVIKAKATDGTNKTASCKIEVRAKKVTISASQKTIYIGSGFKLSAKVTSLSKENVSWSSSNSKVASVTSQGYVKANSTGTAYIYAKLKDGTKSNICKIIVKKKTEPVKEEPKEDVPEHVSKPYTPPETPTPTIHVSAFSVKIGSSIVISASVPRGTWSASGSGKVRLSGNGAKCMVTGTKVGAVHISYTINGKSASINIYVRD